MKSILLLLSLFVLETSVLSQQSNYITDTIFGYTFTNLSDSTLQYMILNELDYNENITSRSDYTWDLGLNDWVGSLKKEYAFDPEGNVILKATYFWNLELNDWVPSSKTEYTFDLDGNNTLMVSYRWDPGLNDWVLSSKSESTFDPEGKQTLMVSYRWDSGLNDWVLSSKSESTFDPEGKQTLMVSYRWDSGLNDWVLSSKTEYTYNAEGNPTLWVNYEWDSGLNDWVLSSKNESTYNAEGNPNLWAIYEWDSGLDIWIGSTKAELSFDPDGNITLEAYYIWDSGLNDWIDEYKFEYSYDPEGNLTLKVYYTWDSDINEFALSVKYFYYRSGSYYFVESDTICNGDSIIWQGDYYDTEGTYFDNYLSFTGRDSIYELNLTVNPTPASFILTGQNTVAEYQIVIYSVPSNAEVVYSWLAENGNVLSYPSDNSAEVQWGSAGEGTITGIAENQYGCKSDTSKLIVTIGSTDINDILNSNLNVYPNPATDRIFINPGDYTKMNGYQLKIMNQLGSVVFETNVEDQLYEISVNTWTGKGLYFVQIIDSDGSVIDTKKIVLQ